MKKITLLLILGLGVDQGFAQKVKESEVPQVVKTAFAKAYPKVKDAEWDKEDGDYEASFDQNKADASVLFSADGTITEVETEIEHNQLPAAVKNTLAKEYTDYKVKEAAKIVAGGVTTYEAEVKKGKQTFDFIFDVDGKLLKKVEKSKEKEEKD